MLWDTLYLPTCIHYSQCILYWLVNFYGLQTLLDMIISQSKSIAFKEYYKVKDAFFSIITILWWWDIHTWFFFYNFICDNLWFSFGKQPVLVYLVTISVIKIHWFKSVLFSWQFEKIWHSKIGQCKTFGMIRFMIFHEYQTLCTAQYIMWNPVSPYYLCTVLCVFLPQHDTSNSILFTTKFPWLSMGAM